MLKSLSFVYKKIKLKKKDIKERERKRESHREKKPQMISLMLGYKKLLGETSWLIKSIYFSIYTVSVFIYPTC